MNTLKCSWGDIKYALWNQDSPETPVIALHGWLDNCRSFSPLCEFLTSPVIAPDLPGHGLSDHLQDGTWYHFVDYVSRIHEFIEKLGTERFHLIGHSMGAAIGSLYASMFPEKVDKLILLDGLGPLVNADDQARDNLQSAILSRLKKERKIKKPYPDIDTAVRARAGAGIISREAAEVLVRHHIKKDTDGYRWTYDPKLVYTSPLRMTPGQLESFIREISSETLIITASKGFIDKAPYWEKHKLIKNVKVLKTSGGHHFHMDSPQETAMMVEEFLK